MSTCALIIQFRVSYFDGGRKMHVWFLQRSLKFLASPTYESVGVSVVTAAWQTTFDARHFPSRRH